MATVKIARIEDAAMVLTGGELRLDVRRKGNGVECLGAKHVLKVGPVLGVAMLLELADDCLDMGSASM